MSIPDFRPSIHGAGRARPTRVERPPHAWGHVQIAESTPADITSIIGDFRARRRDLEARRTDYSKAEFERESGRLIDETRQRVIRRAEQAHAAIKTTHELVARVEKAHRPPPPEEVDRAWRHLQPLFRAKFGVADIARKFANDRAATQAIREYAPNTLRARAGTLDSPQVERGIADLLRYVEVVEHPYLPSELAEARDARRRVEALDAVIAEHMHLAGREIDGQRVTPRDKIAAGLRQADAMASPPSSRSGDVGTGRTPVAAGRGTADAPRPSADAGWRAPDGRRDPSRCSSRDVRPVDDHG